MSYESPPSSNYLTSFFLPKLRLPFLFRCFYFFSIKIFNEVKEKIFSHLFNFPKDTQLTLGRIGGEERGV